MKSRRPGRWVASHWERRSSGRSSTATRGTKSFMRPPTGRRYRSSMAGHARTPADEARNAAMGAGVVDDPYPLFHTLRAECPVVHGTVSERFGMRASAPPNDAGVFSLLAYEDVRRALREDGFSSRWYDPLV